MPRILDLADALLPVRRFVLRLLILAMKVVTVWNLLRFVFAG